MSTGRTRADDRYPRGCTLCGSPSTIPERRIRVDRPCYAVKPHIQRIRTTTSDSTTIVTVIEQFVNVPELPDESYSLGQEVALAIAMTLIAGGSAFVAIHVIIRSV